MKALPPPPGPIQSIRNQAAALRQLATLPDAQQHIDRETEFGLKGTSWHNADHLDPGGEDIIKGPNGPEVMPPMPITPMELIDDACAFEAIADKLTILKRDRK